MQLLQGSRTKNSSPMSRATWSPTAASTFSCAPSPRSSAGENGLLVDFFSPEKIAERVEYALSSQNSLFPLREKARQAAIEKYDLKRVCLPAQCRLVETLAGASGAKRAA